MKKDCDAQKKDLTKSLEESKARVKQLELEINTITGRCKNDEQVCQKKLSEF